MYDWELQNYLNERNNVLSNKEYIYVCNTCPQLNHIRYNSFNNYYEAWSNYNYFKFQVYLDNN